jgi:hypothetical protein
MMMMMKNSTLVRPFPVIFFPGSSLDIPALLKPKILLSLPDHALLQRKQPYILGNNFSCIQYNVIFPTARRNRRRSIDFFFTIMLLYRTSHMSKFAMWGFDCSLCLIVSVYDPRPNMYVQDGSSAEMTAKAENRTKCIFAVSTLRQLWREYNLKQPTHL